MDDTAINPNIDWDEEIKKEYLYVDELFRHLALIGSFKYKRLIHALVHKGDVGPTALAQKINRDPKVIYNIYEAVSNYEEARDKKTRIEVPTES